MPIKLRYDLSFLIFESHIPVARGSDVTVSVQVRSDYAVDTAHQNMDSDIEFSTFVEIRICDVLLDDVASIFRQPAPNRSSQSVKRTMQRDAVATGCFFRRFEYSYWGLISEVITFLV